jgi:COP9 signalosome complex subunit 2
MSDDFEYEYDPDEDFNEPQEDYELENLFFEADDIKRSNPSKSIELFENIIIVEESLTSKDFKWKFKCLLNIIQLKANLGKFEEIIEDLSRLAEVLNTVSRNISNEAVFSIIECLNNAEPHLSAKIMDHLLHLLEQHQHLWMSAALKLAQNYLKIGELEYYLLKFPDF